MKIDPRLLHRMGVRAAFFYNFYVYQYATSIAGAAEFTDRIVTEGRPAAERFLTCCAQAGRITPTNFTSARHRLGDGRALSGADRAHEPHHG
jgi:oligoendopeptidase F